jgi:N-acetylmuramic acid 6-phosphate etherase
MFFIGIDLGGSGTRAVLATADGEVLAAGRGGPSGAHGGAAGRRHIERALASALAPIAARVGTAACRVHVGVRGLSIPGRREAVLLDLSVRLPQADVHISNDATIAMWGGLAAGEGVAVLAGTGSIAMARSGDGREARSGGYGYLVGDEGSAFWLGREAIAACLRALDGRSQPTLLRDLVCQVTQQRTPQDLIGWLYAGQDQVPRLAGLAPLVSRAAEADDPVAMSLMGRAARDLADLADAAARQAWPSQIPEALPIACCGGVWAAGDVLRQPFASALVQRLPLVKVCEPRLAPVGGAILLAMGARETPLAANVVARVEDGLA